MSSLCYYILIFTPNTIYFNSIYNRTIQINLMLISTKLQYIVTCAGTKYILGLRQGDSTDTILI